MRIVELKVLNFIRWIFRMGLTSHEQKQMEAYFFCLGWLTLALDFFLSTVHLIEFQSWKCYGEIGSQWVIVWVSILHLWKFHRNVSLLFLNVPEYKFVCNPLTPAVFIIVKITDAVRRPLQNTLQWKHTEARVDHATKIRCWCPCRVKRLMGNRGEGLLSWCDYWHCRWSLLTSRFCFLQIVEWCTIGASNWQYRI